MDSRYEDLLNHVKPFGQEHLLRFWHDLDEEQRDILAQEIKSTDFPLIARLFREGQTPEEGAAAEPSPLRGKAWNSFGIFERAAMANSGMRALRDGKVAAFLVAGGQGTRLGHEGPKGTFDIGLPSHKSLFQLQAERIGKLGRIAGKAIPWYVMTSLDNHAATEEFFRRNAFFGLKESDIFLFQQGQLPVVDSLGQILLEEKHRLSQGPNGNGGCFLGLESSGALDDMKKRGVEWVFVYSVDNALVKVCDPHFVGFAMASSQPAASKAVAKAGPEERVGVFCLRNGRPSVIEYSELSEQQRQARNTEGQLLFGSGNIAVHLFRRDFLAQESIAPLPYHVAHKRIPFLDAAGLKQNPPTPNAYKFELFMFDMFPRATGMAVLEVVREEEFAPVKNREGADSPETARALVLSLHRTWAIATGCTEAQLSSNSVEISPRLSYAGEGLTADQILAVSPKDGAISVEV